MANDTRTIDIDGRMVVVETIPEKRKRGPNKLPLMIEARPGQSLVKELAERDYPSIKVYRDVRMFRTMSDMVGYMSFMFTKEFVAIGIDPSRATTTRFFTKEINDKYVEYQAVIGYEGY